MRKSKQHRKNRDLEALGDAIRNRRVDLELTQNELGELAVLHRTYVTDIEGGLRHLIHNIIEMSAGMKKRA